jgi:hypothetical protein
MGYTHYYRDKPAFTDAQWKLFCDDVADVYHKCRNIIGGPSGEEDDPRPRIGRNDISFNGIGDQSHETCYVPKAATDFEFCKTARKPYDIAVVEVYKLVRKYLPTTKLSSDGGDEVFGGKKVKVGKYTYLTGDLDVSVGDVVRLPCGHRNKKKYSDGSWEGEVTAIGSDYEGDCKYIIEIVSKAGPLDHLDADEQITTEELIAQNLFEELQYLGVHEEQCNALGRAALLIVAETLGVAGKDNR